MWPPRRAVSWCCWLAAPVGRESRSFRGSRAGWDRRCGYRLVMLDQRGTGARALNCPALQRQMGASNLTVPTPAAVRSCAAAIGPHRRYFTTADTVADIEALRSALGVSRLTLDGVSYGSYVAEQFALTHPAQVSRLVLDSVVPSWNVDPFQLAGMRRTATVLRAVCAAQGALADRHLTLAVRSLGAASATRSLVGITCMYEHAQQLAAESRLRTCRRFCSADGKQSGIGSPRAGVEIVGRPDQLGCQRPEVSCRRLA